MTAAGYMYSGTIRHRRLAVRAHAFRHRLALLYVDVERVDEVLGGRLVAASPGPVRFRRADYLGDPRRPLADEVRRVVEERAGWRPDDSIRLLTHPRALGRCFNPVSFYYCFDAEDRLGAVLAEVTNTPWGERAAYVLRVGTDGPVLHGEASKRLHVSPFMGMAQRYAWRATEPGPTLSIHVANLERGRAVFDATLSLRRGPLTATALWRFPLGMIRVLLLIYGHAVALKLKGGSRAPQTERDGMSAARRICLRLLARMPHGQLMVVEGGRRVTVGDGEPHATVRINTARAWTALLHGSRGLAEAYALGWWDADDPAAVIRVAARNAPVLDGWRRRVAPVRVPAQALRGIRRANSRADGRRDIAKHYDIGDDLFGLMLDDTMMYSSAYFPFPGASLVEASRAKLELVCEKLSLGPHDHVVEIGTGWGGFAVHAAATRDCRITTTTTAAAQYAHARRRVERAGVEKLVTVVQQDYRDLRGRYDKLVSIEMIEAVGWRSLGTFFARCSQLLEPDGLMLLQSIVIDDRAYEVEKASASFIRTHMFPGGSLPSVEIIARCLARHTDLRIADLHELTPHYAETLRRWRANLVRAGDQLHRLGYDERFRRLWHLYLAYCEAGFDEGRIGVVQMLLGKPRWRPSIAAAPVRQLGERPGGGADPEQPAEPVGAGGDLLG